MIKPEYTELEEMAFRCAAAITAHSDVMFPDEIEASLWVSRYIHEKIRLTNQEIKE